MINNIDQTQIRYDRTLLGATVVAVVGLSASTARYSKSQAHTIFLFLNSVCAETFVFVTSERIDDLTNF